MIKITTKYIGPRGLTGARVRARATVDGRRRQFTEPYDYALNSAARHRHTASVLAGQLGLTLVGGGESTSTGWIFTAEVKA